MALDNTLWWTFPFLNTWGADLLKQDANGFFECVLDRPEAVAAFRFKADLSLKKERCGDVDSPIEAGAWMPAALNKDQGFLTGRYAMVFSGPWNLDTFHRGVDDSHQFCLHRF